MNKDNIILGKDIIYNTDCNATGINNNIAVVGGSGSGKTMSIIEPRLIETYDSNLIVTVTKRKIVEKYKDLFLKRGYEVLDLNFIEPTKSNVSYDPLLYVNSYTDITFLAESIVMANGRKKGSVADPYWDQSAVSLLSAEIAYVLMTKDNATFGDVIKMHRELKISEKSSCIESKFHYEFFKIEEEDPNCFAVSCWKSFCDLPIKTASCIYSTLNVTIDAIFTPELIRMIEKSSKLDFIKFANTKSILFVSSSAVNPALNSFVNIFYSQAIKQLFEYAESRANVMLPIPVQLICDDFATGSKINNFAEYISVFREKQISVILLLQSESQLQTMYSYCEATTIINNCDTYVYMGGMDLKTCENISRKVNMPLEDVLYMAIGDVIIFRRGKKPKQTKRYNILENKIYNDVTNVYNKKIVNCNNKLNTFFKIVSIK